MFDLTKLLEIPPFSLNKSEKTDLYAAAMQSLTSFHFKNCQPYQKILSNLGFDSGRFCQITGYPFLPVRLFKDYELVSVDRSEIIKTMTSSGTSDQRISKIFLDRETAINQTKVLTKIVSNLIGAKRLPLLIVDTKAVVKNRKFFSARGAGILGFSMFGIDVTYALDEDMMLDIDAIQSFCEEHRNENILQLQIVKTWNHHKCFY